MKSTFIRLDLDSGQLTSHLTSQNMNIMNLGTSAISNRRVFISHGDQSHHFSKIELDENDENKS